MHPAENKLCRFGVECLCRLRESEKLFLISSIYYRKHNWSSYIDKIGCLFLMTLTHIVCCPDGRGGGHGVGVSEEQRHQTWAHHGTGMP